jgi:hypothetical protein
MPITPNSDITTAFRGWEARVKSRCASRFKTWRSWKLGDTAADDEVSTNLCPYIRLTPMVSAETRVVSCGTLTESATPIRVMIELYTAGYGWDDMSNLWGILSDAMWPQDATERDAMDDALRLLNIDDVKPIRPAMPASPADFGGGIIRGVGEIILDVKAGT